MDDYFEMNYSSNLAKKDDKILQQEKKRGRLVFFGNKAVSKRSTAKILISVFLVFGIAFANIVGYCKNNDTERIISEQEEIRDTNSARIIELNAELDALVSPEMIEKTAVEKLGLVKLDSSDWRHISINEANSIIIADGKTVD